MKRHVFRFLPLLILAVSCARPPATTVPPPVELVLTVLHTNDHHGHPLPFAYRNSPTAGGLPARKTIIDAVRREGHPVLVLDAGDLNTGLPESNACEAAIDIEGYNAIGTDAMAVGNHEFDNSLPVLRRQMSQARFPFLSANVFLRGGRSLFPPYVIRRVAGLRIAIFGLTTRESETIGNPKVIGALEFHDEIATARQLVPELRRKADVVIALVHLGIYPDGTSGSLALAKAVPGIDLVVDGHTHTPIEGPVWVGPTPVVQAWEWGMCVGRADLTIRGRKVTGFSWRPIPVNVAAADTPFPASPLWQAPPVLGDEALLRRLTPYLKIAARTLDEVVAQAEAPFDGSQVRYRPVPLGRLVAESMRWLCRKQKPELAIVNGGSIRADLPAGPVTRRRLEEICPFQITVVSLTLRGRDLATLLDYALAVPPGRGAYPQLAGDVVLVPGPGNPAARIRLGGAPLDPDRVYTVATSMFLRSGGDGYTAFHNAQSVVDTQVLQRDALAAYLRSLAGRIAPGQFAPLPLEAVPVADPAARPAA